MTKSRIRHRPNRGSSSLRLDPYGIDDVAVTLEEWCRWQMPRRRPPARPAPAARHARKER
jgi:hypothetical protein